MAEGIAIKPRYFGRSSSVVISARITITRRSIPPPPRPWRTRAAIIVLMFWAIVKTMEPIRNSPIDTYRGGFRPKALEILAQTGWVTNPDRV